MKKLLFTILKSLPLKISSRIIIKIFHKKSYLTLCENGEHKLALDTLSWQLSHEYSYYAHGPVIFIAGVSRVGKSIIAKSISQERHYGIVNLDRYRYIWNHTFLEDSQRTELKMHFLTQLIKLRKSGLVIEGDELITDDKPDLKNELSPHSLTLQYLSEINKLQETKVVVLGSANISVHQKVSGILQSASKNNCWAAENMSMVDIFKLSELIITMSENLSRMTQQTSITYINIVPEEFDSQVQNIIENLDKIN